MGRVSLTEDYDDRSVIAKLNEMDKRVTENTTVVTAAEASAKASADAAQQTADRFAGSVGAVVQNANAQINASKAQVDQAKAEVDETVTTVAQAVQTANNASASAQQSANTVAGYDTRLTTAEGDIDALQTADTNNVKLKPAGDQHISGTLYIDAWAAYGPQQFNLRGTQTDGWKKIGISDSQGDVTKIQMNREEIQLVGDKIYRNTVPSGADSRSIVNKAYVESTDGATNNLVHRTANEKVDGIKEFAYNTDKHIGTHITTTSAYWVKLVKWTTVSLRYNVVMTLISPYFRDTNFYGKLMFGCWDITNFSHLDLISPYNWANRFKVTYDGNEIALWYNNTSGEYKLGINVFIDIECNGTEKSSRAILIPESEQVAENPDWSSFARVLDGTYKGWGA